MTSFETDSHGYEKIAFHLDIHETELTRYFDPAPFVPSGWQTGKNAAKNSDDAGCGAEKADGTYRKQTYRRRYFRRAGFHAGTARDGEGVRLARPFP